EAWNELDATDWHRIDHSGHYLHKSGQCDSARWNGNAARWNRNPPAWDGDSWDHHSDWANPANDPNDNTEFHHHSEHNSELRNNSGNNTEHQPWTMHQRELNWLHDAWDDTCSGQQ